MKENFDLFLEKVKLYEGYHSVDKDDPGGETLFGVSRKYNPGWHGWATWDSLKGSGDPPASMAWQSLKHVVSSFYKHMYWDEVMADDLPTGVDIFISDTAVNLGVNKASKILQESVLAGVDGIVGSKTVQKANTEDSLEVIGKIFDRRMKHYMTATGGLQREKYGVGWARRTREMYEISVDAYRDHSWFTDGGWIR